MRKGYKVLRETSTENNDEVKVGIGKKRKWHHDINGEKKL